LEKLADELSDQLFQQNLTKDFQEAEEAKKYAEKMQKDKQNVHAKKRRRPNWGYHYLDRLFIYILVDLMQRTGGKGKETCNNHLIVYCIWKC
jgi:hypothetical protein